MKHRLLYFLVVFCFFINMFMFTSCLSHDMYNEQNDRQEVFNHVLSIFKTPFPDSQDWIMTANSTINVHTNNSDVIKVQILMSLLNEKDFSTDIVILNEAQVINGNAIITYDVPKLYDNLFVAFITDKNDYSYRLFKLGDTDIYDNDQTESLSKDYILPQNDLVIWSSVESFANQRNWIPGEMLYCPVSIEYMKANDYSKEFKTIFNNVLFTYLIKNYNSSSYFITTGENPIIISPIYMNIDEQLEADLYYYYFPENRELSVEEIEALPKYQAIDLSTIYLNNDNVKKNKAYALVYYGDTQHPEFRLTVGRFDFPKGYKIGFMYRSKVSDNEKQGELYGDGRLNYNINNYGKFALSNLEDDAPRMKFLNINNKNFLCVECDTDADFNDLIFEIEGGIEPIIISPSYNYNIYTFLFEDRRLPDYDLNDIVLKCERLNETQLRYTLTACGTCDNIYIYNIEGDYINHNNEVHDILGCSQSAYINTIIGDNVNYVSDIINVDKDFSFLDVITQPYIWNKNEDFVVKISTQGEDPHAIMIPYDFKWPIEKFCIKNAYMEFNSWGMNDLLEENDWYKRPNENNIFIIN